MIRRFLICIVPGLVIFSLVVSCGIDTLGFYEPVKKGTIEISYGENKDPFTGVKKLFHGYTYSNLKEAKVYAAEDGTVSHVDMNERTYGKYIIIEHENDLKTLYANLGDISVEKGERVAKGKKIGVTGNTGRTYFKNQLYFAVFKSDTAVDPGEYLLKKNDN